MMRGPWRTYWRLPSLSGQYLITREGEGAPKGYHRVPSIFMASTIEARFSSPLEAGTLLELYEAVGGVRPTSPGGQWSRNDHEAIKRRLREAFERGELVGFEAPPRLLRHLPDTGPDRSVAPAPEEAVETTFIAIQLVDTDNNPVPNVRYRLTLPDGSVREGALSASGYELVERIPPGQCQVAFLDRFDGQR